jgi:hypothetical protein
MLFAQMNQHFRFTRVKLRGLAGAAEEFLPVATIQNLALPHPAATAQHPVPVLGSDALREHNMIQKQMNTRPGWHYIVLHSGAADDHSPFV